ncbi:hypothetical protein K402DRAFT_450943 [Aulographum hederae CBS 113979]|uniref:RING-type domain-containing protein n=1 Tax=Aulographum hederae CBS 113979 TaxID=1176131 RepID=A0A6G1HCD4_9PEZI|nr:hypothetical protein K402DRAFT_450943 [Aulographum hederae CBS 113979]
MNFQGTILTLIINNSHESECSTVFIRNLPYDTTAAEIENAFDGIGFHQVTIDCIYMLEPTTATVRVRDPAFAENCNRDTDVEENRKGQKRPPEVTGRKLKVSWAKSTRTAFFRFGTRGAATRVSETFNSARYECLGKAATASVPVATKCGCWSIWMSGVPLEVTVRDLEKSIAAVNDVPELTVVHGPSCPAAEAEVSVVVRSRLEVCGTLESFALVPSSERCDRSTVSVLFQDDGAARAAASLDGTPLHILEQGRLSVQLIQSTKAKMPKQVYRFLKYAIKENTKGWKRARQLNFRVINEAKDPLTTLENEGEDATDVLRAREELNDILEGAVLYDDPHHQEPLWIQESSRNGRVSFHQLRTIERDMGIARARDKRNRRLKFYGQPQRIPEAVRRIKEIFEDAVSTQRTHPAMNQHDQICVVCFSEPEDPVILGRPQCLHTYCLDCFSNCCKSAALDAATSSAPDFQIKCCGRRNDDFGRDIPCGYPFPLRAMEAKLAPELFDQILQRSLDLYLARHLNEFRVCPTPDCGYVYSCVRPSATVPAAAPNSLFAAPRLMSLFPPSPRPYICPGCRQRICTSCHADHTFATCAEYRDSVENNAAAMDELGVKKCPMCNTPLMKGSGCNHVVLLELHLTSLLIDACRRAPVGGKVDTCGLVYEPDLFFMVLSRRYLA